MVSASSSVVCMRLDTSSALYSSVHRLSPMPAPERLITASQPSNAAGSSSPAAGSHVNSPAFASRRTNRVTVWPSADRWLLSAVADQATGARDEDAHLHRVCRPKEVCCSSPQVGRSDAADTLVNQIAAKGTFSGHQRRRQHVRTTTAGGASGQWPTRCCRRPDRCSRAPVRSAAVRSAGRRADLPPWCRPARRASAARARSSVD